MTTDRMLSIIQYNMRKDKDGTMAEFFRDEDVLGTDVIAVQEPWSNKYSATTHHPQKQAYYLVWPTDEVPNETRRAPARVCFFIHKRIDPAAIKITNHSTTLQTIVLDFKSYRRTKRIAIHNLYLIAEDIEGVMSAKETVDTLQKAITDNKQCEQIVLGDFNAWHSDWFGRRVQPTGQATRVKNLMEDHGLELWLAPGTVTRPGERINGDNTNSTIDLIWGTQQVTESMVECEALEFLMKSSDHIPIRTILDFNPNLAPVQEEWKFKEAHWDKYRRS